MGIWKDFNSRGHEWWTKVGGTTLTKIGAIDPATGNWTFGDSQDSLIAIFQSGRYGTSLQIKAGLLSATPTNTPSLINFMGTSSSTSYAVIGADIGITGGGNLISDSSVLNGDLCIVTKGKNIRFSGDGTTVHGSMSTTGVWAIGNTTGTLTHLIYGNQKTINSSTDTTPATLSCPLIQLSNSNSTTNNYEGLSFHESNGNAIAAIVGVNIAHSVSSNGAIGRLEFYTKQNALTLQKVGSASEAGAWNFPISTTTPLLKVTSGGTAATGTITLASTTWKFGATVATITEAGDFSGITGAFTTSVTTPILQNTAATSLSLQAAASQSIQFAAGGTAAGTHGTISSAGAWNFPISTTTPLLKVTSGGTAATGTITLASTTWKFGATVATITEAGAFSGITGAFTTSVDSPTAIVTTIQNKTSGGVTYKASNGSTTIATLTEAGIFTPKGIKSGFTSVSSMTSGSAYTFLTIPSEECVYLFIVLGINNVNDTGNYGACSIVTYENGASIYSLFAGVHMAVTVSGLDIKVNQTSGSTQTVVATWLRIN